MSALPVDDAADVLEGLLEKPDADGVLDAVRRFAAIEFDAVSDDFAFEYGTLDWGDGPFFAIGFSRQLEPADAELDMVQARVELQYEIDADLIGAGDWSSEWTAGGPKTFDAWLDAVAARPIWTLVRGRSLRGIEVAQDGVF